MSRSMKSRHPRRHYVVIENTPGYLPESEPATFRSKAAAQSYMLDLQSELREQGFHRSYGSSKEGYIEMIEKSKHALPRVIEMTEEEGEMEEEY